MKMLLPQNSCTHTHTRSRGLTLIELLAVIAVIAILAAILIPAVSHVRRHAMSSTCASNLRQVGVASQLYSTEFRGLFPLDSTGDSWLCWWHELAYYFIDAERQINTQTIQRGGREITYNISLLTTPDGERIGHGWTERNIPIYSSPAARARHDSIGGWEARNHYIRVYAMNQRLANPEGARMASVDDPSRTMLFMNARRGGQQYYHRVAVPGHYPRGPHTGDHDFIHPGDSVNVVFVDGSVSNIRSEDLPRSGSDPFWNPRPQ